MTVRRFLLRGVLGAVLVVALVIGGTAFRVWQVARIDDRTQVDVAIVLGTAQYDGRPSDAFRARLEHAKTLYDDGVAKNLLTVGGRQAGDNYTEAQAGQMWLTANGVPADKIVAVGQGSDTLASLRAVAPVYRERGWESAVVVSDPWHSLRSQTMAHDTGISAGVSPTHSGPMVQTRQTQFQQIVRETGALLFYRLSKSPADELGASIS
ncbi:vancomycin permeability regulator SanA [Kutzneria viridogrisea]|uniref:Vancomycin permeability regulator SanA n=1 Tax=Kutzneria viridogrisea TaxID=47990 RepID=A0ABR6BKX6_9PSEU|nr:vancomycin permeability regulator SanA [Kutzneria viridogrisea]